MFSVVWVHQCAASARQSTWSQNNGDDLQLSQATVHWVNSKRPGALHHRVSYRP